MACVPGWLWTMFSGAVRRVQQWKRQLCTCRNFTKWQHLTDHRWYDFSKDPKFKAYSGELGSFCVDVVWVSHTRELRVDEIRASVTSLVCTDLFLKVGSQCRAWTHNPEIKVVTCSTNWANQAPPEFVFNKIYCKDFLKEAGTMRDVFR